MLDYKLETFIVLCETNSYRKTAERLNMTQPAVTHHIKQLEALYECKLFSYKNRTLRKTKEAEILEEYVRSARYNSEKLRRALIPKTRETLKIGTTRTIGDYIIIEEIANLIKNNDIALGLTVDNTENLLSALRKGKIDIAFIEGFIDREEFDYKVYRREELVCVAAKTSPLCGGEYQLSELLCERLILREEGSGTREALSRVLNLHNMSIENFDRTIETNSFKIITELVAKGVGISFVYRSVALGDDNIAEIKLKGSRLLHEFGCVYLKDTNQQKFLDSFFKVEDVAE